MTEKERTATQTLSFKFPQRGGSPEKIDEGVEIHKKSKKESLSEGGKTGSPNEDFLIELPSNEKNIAGKG